MIHVSEILGGPELRYSHFSDSVVGIGFPAPGESWPEAGTAPDPLGRERRDLRNVGSLDLVFHVPGSILKPEHAGLRTGRFSRKERMLQIQIAVPEELMESPRLRAHLLQSIRSAVEKAEPRLAKAGIPYPKAEYLSQIDELERRLGLAESQ